MQIIFHLHARQRRCHAYCINTPLHHFLNYRWRFVVHGGIDGFSRLIVFLNAATNNRASTVMSSFLEAVNNYGVPSRVRSDKGGENVQVAHFMVSTRGPDRNSHLTGRSTHNQRYYHFVLILYVLRKFLIDIGSIQLKICFQA